MFARIAAITLILACTSVGWFILGGTIDRRTHESDDKSRPGAASILGSPQEQGPPTASYEQEEQEKVETETDGHKTTRTVTRSRAVPLSLDASRINAALALEYRQRGLLWYSTYVVDFSGAYTFRNPTSEPQVVTYRFKFPVEHAIYDGLVIEVNGRALPIHSGQGAVSVAVPLTPLETAVSRIGYRSHGLESWLYRPADEVGQAGDFELNIENRLQAN